MREYQARHYDRREQQTCRGGLRDRGFRGNGVGYGFCGRGFIRGAGNCGEIP